MIRRGLLVLALTVTAFSAAAPTASAGNVWLWACHGPDGSPLPALGDGATSLRLATADCATSGSAGLRAPATGDGSLWDFRMPADAPLSLVRIHRTIALGEGQTYALRAGQVELENDSATPASGERIFRATGSQVQFEVKCAAEECPTGGGVDARHLAFRVTDDHRPTGAVAGWHTPATEKLELEVLGRDVGVGLRDAKVFRDGEEMDSERFGDSSCRDLSSGGDIDLPYGLVALNDRVIPAPVKPLGCVTRGKVNLTVPLPESVDGPRSYAIRVQVTDQAGNSSDVLDTTTEVRPAPPNRNTATLAIGTTGVAAGPTPTTTTPTPAGGVAGASATSCRAPRLAVELAERPVRVRRGVAVLRYGRPYRFTGRLTCEVNGRRRAAPKRTLIELLRTAGGKTRERGGTTTAPGGRVDVILSFTRARTIVFRFRGVGSQRAQVRIPIRVERLRRLGKATIRARWLRYVLPRDQVRFTSIDARSVPRGATVRVRCQGPGCPGGFDRRTAARRARGTMSVLGGLEDVNLRPGASVDVTIAKRGFRGIGKLYCIRADQRVQVTAYTLDGERPSCG